MRALLSWMVIGVMGCCAVGCSPELLAELAIEESPAMRIDRMQGFSWVAPGALAAMPRPRVAHGSFLAAQRIDFVISLTEERPHWLVEQAMPGLHLPVADFQPPTLEQQHTFVEAVADRVAAGQRVAVHCTAGLGRSGTLVATWLVAQGATAQDAIDLIRRLRPGSIETAAQEAQVGAFEADLRD
ncbi:MAG: atypical dual specificity phosphatase [Bradymonadia bacterium]|jgi:atypical dual specificity phosphatase